MGNFWCCEVMIMVYKRSNRSKIMEREDQSIAYVTMILILKLQSFKGLNAIYTVGLQTILSLRVFLSGFVTNGVALRLCKTFNHGLVNHLCLGMGLYIVLLKPWLSKSRNEEHYVIQVSSYPSRHLSCTYFFFNSTRFQKGLKYIS